MKTHRPPAELKRFQHRMRRWPSNYEENFALRLQSLGIPFKRQVIVGFYIVDFILPTHMLCIEIDGPEHKSRIAYDKTRTAFLESSGFKVMRFANSEVQTVDLSFVAGLPAYSARAFPIACATAQSRKSSVIRGKSSLPTIGQKSLF